MSEVRRSLRRWGWESSGDARRRNPVGDWSSRIGLTGIGVLFFGMALATTVSDRTSTKAGLLAVAAVFALGGLTLALAGIRKATHGNKSARSAVWGLVLALLLAALVVLVYYVSLWVRR